MQAQSVAKAQVISTIQAMEINMVETGLGACRPYALKQLMLADSCMDEARRSTTDEHRRSCSINHQEIP